MWTTKDSLRVQELTWYVNLIENPTWENISRLKKKEMKDNVKSLQSSVFKCPDCLPAVAEVPWPGCTAGQSSTGDWLCLWPLPIDNFIMLDQIQIYFRMWRQNKTPSSCPGGLENLLVSRDSPEDVNPNLLLCHEQPGPDSQLLDLEYLPYYRTSHICVCPASHICTEREKSSSEGKANTKQDEKVSYSAPPQETFHTVGHLKSFLANHPHTDYIYG